MLFEEPQEKKASAGEPWHDYSAYETDEHNYRVEATMEKAAEEAPKPKATDGFSKRQIVDRVVKYASELEDRRRFAEERVGMAQSVIATRLSKAARDLSSGYEPYERYALFKAACSKKCPNAVREIEKLVSPAVVKEASAFARKFRRMNVIDDSSVESMRKMAEQLESDLATTEKIAGLVDVVSKKEAAAKKLISDYAKTEKKAGWNSGNTNQNPNQNKKKDKDSKLPTDKAEDPWLGKALSTTAKATKATLKAGVPEAPPGVKEIWNYLQGGGITAEKIDKALAGPEGKSTKLRDYVNNIVRSDIISDLYANDPVLSEADPQALTAAYENLVAVAPQASMNKEIVRAILRQSVNSVAVSPFDAKQWADLDSVLLKNRTASA